MFRDLSRCRPHRHRFRLLPIGIAVFATLAALRAEELRIVCTTTHLSAIARGIGGEHVTVQSIIPFGMCPGHFELTPKEARNLRTADLILAHGYERFLDDIRHPDSENPLRRIAVSGNWLTPDVQKKAAAAVADHLRTAAPAQASDIRTNLATYLQTVDEAADKHAETAAKLPPTTVLCATMIQGFARHIGFNVAATFPRDEDVSAKKMARLARLARDQNVRMIVDNRQSSGKVGRTLARELDVPLVVFSNFPPDKTGPQACTKTVRENLKKARHALAVPNENQDNPPPQ